MRILNKCHEKPTEAAGITTVQHQSLNAADSWIAEGRNGRESM